MSVLIYADMHADGGEPEGRTELKSTIPMKRGDNPKRLPKLLYGCYQMKHPIQQVHL
jgi:hypothetical protein